MTVRTKKSPRTRKRSVKPAPAKTDSVQKTTGGLGVETSKKTPSRLPSSWAIARKTIRLLAAHWQYFVGFTVVFGLLNILLVHNFSINVPQLKDEVETLLGQSNSLAATVGTYALFVTSAGGAAGAAAVYQYALLVTGSLAIIWSLRQLTQDNPPVALRIRDSYYKGMGPFVPFVIVLAVLGLTLMPVLIGGSIYGILANGGVVKTITEQMIVLGIFVLLAALSLWLVARFLFAMYIVTLQDVVPLQALRNARAITAGHALSIIRKLLFLGVVLFGLTVVILVPAIALWAPVAQWLFFVFSMACLTLVHGYLYTLYRELLA